jgi:hypothetical protein
MPQRGRNLKLVSESEATGRTAELFADIRQVLGVPYVGLIFRAFGAYPKFLELFWNSVRPGLLDAESFACAERLRASAYTRVYSYFPVPDFCGRTEQLQLSDGARQELTATAELLFYYSSVQLLLSALALQAFDRPLGTAPKSPRPPEHPLFHVCPVLIDEPAATPRVARIYDEIKRAFGAPVVNTDFRAFARFPDFLEEYWTVLRRTIESPVYNESQFGLQDAALSLAREFPAEVHLGKERLEAAGIDDDDIAGVLRATELFVKLLSAGLINLAIAKIGFDGGSNTHSESRQEPAKQSVEPTRAA